MSNSRDPLFYNTLSISVSQESKIIFLDFSNGSAQDQKIALSYQQAARLSRAILEKLQENKEVKSEDMSASKDPRRITRQITKPVRLDPNTPISQLQPLFMNGAPEVRLQVVRVLARRKNTNDIFLVIRASSDRDARVRRLATEALGNYPSDECVSILVEQLKDQDKVVRLKAIESLSRISEAENVSNSKKDDGPSSSSILANINVAPALTELIEDPSVTLRRSAAELLTNIGTEKMVSIFAKILKDEDDQIRLMAAKALANVGGGVSVSVLALAARDKDPKIREIAAKALGDMGNQTIIPILLDILNTDENPDVRQKAAESLAKLGKLLDSSITKQLLRILKNDKENEGVRAAVVNILGRVGTINEIPILISLLKESSSVLRMNASIALGKIKDPMASPTLRYIFETDNDPHVRGSAVWALGEIGDTESVKFITKALTDKNANVRASAAEALGKLKIPETAEALEAALEDKDDYVRSHVLQALEKLQA